MEPKVFTLDQITEALAELDPIGAIEEGFVAYSEGKAIVPPVGELIFKDPPGEMHIKYGYIVGDEFYVVKIASGFYENLKLGLPNSSGLMLLFLQRTGGLAAVLLDEGHLTNVRTAAAGAIAARYLAPEKITRIGVFGAGVQGRMQVEYLEKVTDCRDLVVWGVNEEELATYQSDMEPKGYRVETTLDAAKVGPDCGIIVMATPSKTSLLIDAQVQPGTHITAMGSDTAEKQEVDPRILQRADLVVVDSIEQCRSRGEVFQAMKAGLFEESDMRELGDVIAGRADGRTAPDQITLADLTGVAVQDIQISKAVFEALTGV